MTTKRTFLTLSLGALAGACLPSQAQGFPSKPITLVVPFAPGGATDTTLDKTAVLALDTMAGTVATKTLTPAGGTKAKLDVGLAAGEVLFFKYKNGRSFVRQP